jgi:hypothetical protein
MREGRYDFMARVGDEIIGCYHEGIFRGTAAGQAAGGGGGSV